MSELETVNSSSISTREKLTPGISRASVANTPKAVRIFLVDDSADFLVVITRHLSANPLFEVVGSANSGKFALEQIARLEPDLVIIDVVMPGMNGIEAARKLKQQAASLKVIVISFQDYPEYKGSAEAIGADGFFTKSDFCDKVTGHIEELFRSPIVC